MSVLIRFETPRDAPAISSVVEAALRHHPHSDGGENAIVAELRATGDLTISLVAEIDGQAVGHVAFSPVRVDPSAPGWYGLGPLAVHPSHQACGIGSALVMRGLKEQNAIGAMSGVVFGAACPLARPTRTLLAYPVLRNRQSKPTFP